MATFTSSEEDDLSDNFVDADTEDLQSRTILFGIASFLQNVRADISLTLVS